MTVWRLLIALCLVMPAAGAIAVIRDVHSGWAAYTVAVAAALLAGAGFAWLLHLCGRVLVPRHIGVARAGADWPYRLLYIAAAGWLILSLLTGMWLAEFVVGYL